MTLEYNPNTGVYHGVGEPDLVGEITRLKKERDALEVENAALRKEKDWHVYILDRFENVVSASIDTLQIAANHNGGAILLNMAKSVLDASRSHRDELAAALGGEGAGNEA